MNPLTLILVVLLVMLLIGAFPVWPHAAAWGYGPAGVLMVVLVVVLILILTGRMR